MRVASFSNIAEPDGTEVLRLPSNLLTLLRARQAADPRRVLFSFLDNNGLTCAELTARALDERARAIAALLQARGMHGQRALLAYPAGPEFVVALFGCFYARVVAVPVALHRPRAACPWIGQVVSASGARCVLTTLSALDDVLAGLEPKVANRGLSTLVTDTIRLEPSRPWHPPGIRGSDPAIFRCIQGSTDPRNATHVSHARLLRSADAIRQVFELDSRSVSVTWLPNAHDMGFVDGILVPILAGFRSVVIPPERFLRDPACWLKTIAKYEATHSGAPDFAFRYCVREISTAERVTIDLSSWTSVYHGSGRSQPDALSEFTEAFRASRFSPRIAHRCYGKALAFPSIFVDEPERRNSQTPNARSPDLSPFRSVANGPSVISLKRADEAHGRTGRGLDLQDEARLDPLFHVSQTEFCRVSAARSILLTGATGFLGGFLLHDLLENTTAQIHCLLRCANHTHGMRRIELNLRALGIWDDRLASRINPVRGDLGKPLFGLSAPEYRSLAGCAEVVYHAAGRCHQVYPYLALRTANVQATCEVLRFAAAVKLKPLQYVSSLSVFESAAYAGATITEPDLPDRCDGIYAGWSQSKWVAERLVIEARDRGLPVSIYRLPSVGGHSRTGAWVSRDFHCQLIKGCIQLGQMPDLDVALDLAPADFVGRSIGTLSRLPDSLGSTFHLNNPRPLHWADLRGALNRFGYAVALSSYRDWTRRLADEGRATGNALYSLMPMFLRRWSAQELTVPELNQRTHRPRLNSTATLQSLRNASLEWPRLDHDLLFKYFTHLIETGYLAPPNSR